ncbi:MAG: Mov34/MPN/PAD-1 family protein [Planctomycetota bacterium]|nr:Mov34/MPN/PAD-1 family protein [Planctomycetota bacterium]
MTEKKSQRCVSNVDPKDAPSGAFPGRLPKDELRICVLPGAYEAMLQHAKSSLENEVCGVMLGQLKKDSSGPYLMIEDVIQGQAAQSAPAKVTYTAETWTYIHKEQESRDPKLKMVGWYHTHPRFGIFLSSYDQFIHENFFSVEPWMVAFVIDPVKDEEGFFYWSRGKITRALRHWIGDQPRISDGSEFDGRDIQDDHNAQAPAPRIQRPGQEQPAAGAPPVAMQEDLGLGGFSNGIVLGLMGLFLVYLIMTLILPDKNSRAIQEMATLQKSTLMVQGDLAWELAEMRKHLKVPESPRHGTLQVRILRLRQRLMELEKEAKEKGLISNKDKAEKTEDKAKEKK